MHDFENPSQKIVRKIKANGIQIHAYPNQWRALVSS